MNFKQQYTISRLLFGISISILLLFIGSWLYGVYTKKQTALDDKISLLWIQEMKKMETDSSGQAIQELIKNLQLYETLHAKGLPGSSIQSENLIIKVDSLPRHHQFSNDLDTATYKYKEIITIDVHSDELHHPILEDTGRIRTSSIEMFIQTTLNQNEFSVDDLKQQLHTRFEKEALPLDFNIVHFMDTSMQSKDTAANNRIFKPYLSNHRYRLDLELSFWTVLGRMKLEIGVAFIILLIISMAFYAILRFMRQQNQLVTIKNDLISNITHELRTPIFTVSVALEALEKFNTLQDPKRTQEYLEISRNELNRLSILVEKVLKTSVFEQPIADFSPEPIIVNDWLQNIEKSLKLLLEKHQAILNLALLTPSPQLKLDKIHFTNVIYNLIDNALKYNNQTPIITIQTYRQKEQFILQIKDNGIGIAPEHLPRLFDKFFRVPTHNKHNVKGYGLGLHYVASVVHEHGGTIEAQSEIGKGTTFIIKIP